VRIFIAGTMRGSQVDTEFEDQSYRKKLTKLMRKFFPDAEIYDPLEGCDIEQSNEISDVEGRDIFLSQNEVAGKVDVLIAHLPEASMGTAIEMWEAYCSGAIVVSITPMAYNWAVKFLSHVVCQSLFDFESRLKDGSIQTIIKSSK